MCLNVLKNDIKHILRQKQTGFFCKHKKAALSTFKLFHVFLMRDHLLELTNLVGIRIIEKVWVIICIHSRVRKS